MQEIIVPNRKIIPDLFEIKFMQLQKLGADCIADIDHLDMLIAQRHLYLIVAKDLCKVRDGNQDDLAMAHAYCKLAESIQDLIEFWEN